jgi:hypothetical protein
MALTTTISQQDALTAANFLQQLIAANENNVDVSQGSAVYDLVVTALSYVSAYLQKERDGIQLRQSLRDLANLPDDVDANDATDAILSNWFLTRNSGSYARGTATVHLSQAVDVTIPASNRILASTSLVYFPDTQTSFFLPATTLTPTVDATGAVIDWTGKFPLVASQVGTAYNQATPARFIAYDTFNPYVTYIEYQTPISGGLGTQTSSDFIAESQNAISLRALINSKSNDVTLRALFSSIQKVITVGAGDPEMFRDLITEIANGIQIHSLGFMDVYTRLPLQQNTEYLTVGDTFTRNDGEAVTLIDTNVNFQSAGVQQSDILFVESGLPEAPFQFVVTSVAENSITISSRTPFSQATEANPLAPPIMYTVGNNYPGYNNKVSGAGGIAIAASTGTSEQIQQTGVVFLAPNPVYNVSQVEITNVPSVLQPWVNGATNSVVFSVRKNGLNPVGIPGSPLSFNVFAVDPANGQSATGMFGVDIGWPGHPFDNQTLQVTYDTSSGFSAIDSYVRNPDNRIICANSLVKGMHPIYVSFTVPYTLTVDPTILSQQAQNVFDPVAAASGVAAFINSYQANDELDFSLLATVARSQNGLLGSIGGFPINYTLYGPNGLVYNYTTTDKISIFPSTATPPTNAAQLLNPTDFGLPTTGYAEQLAQLLSQLGISARTVQYICSPGAVTFSQQ